MSRAPDLRPGLSSSRNCRNFLTSSRVRRDAWAEKLDMQWHELRQHAVIEKDPDTLSRLIAEIDKRQRRREAPVKGNGS